MLYPDLAAATHNPTNRHGMVVVGGNSSSDVLTFKFLTSAANTGAAAAAAAHDGCSNTASIELDRAWSFPAAHRAKGLMFVDSVGAGSKSGRRAQALAAVVAPPDPDVAFLSTTPRRCCSTAQLVRADHSFTR